MTLDPRLPELYGQASELDGEAREAWLAELREQDPALAREVEELLAGSHRGEWRYATPAWEGVPAVEIESDAPIPERVGPYRIVREIGRGGMGRVFLAEQEEAEFRRNVALKIIDRPGAGPDRIRRFRDEVRILALLEHPGIARFFDGGRAADGTWFLALEYVEGEDLLAYARARGLDLRARVDLFLQVLDAVDYAHRRLVVHRDLKPSNVVVGADGRARLLDFGISRIIDPDSEDDVTLTQTRALTPAYASPEQLRGAPATVATDVYSLGVILYELLAGRRPFSRAQGSGLDDASLARKPEPPAVTGDLDAITLKALRSEPEKRYPSVEALAADLRRWLAGRPVEARRGGRRYRAAKFVRRNRWPVAFASLAAVVLVAGVAGIVVQSRRATRAAAAAQEQRDFALRELSRAEAINELNAFLLFDAAPEGKPFTAGELLRHAEDILERQRGEPDENRAELLIAIGRQYHAKDEQAKALRILTEAYELTRRSPEPAIRAKAACALANTLASGNEFERAERLLREGVERLPDEPQFVLRRVFCLQRGSAVARSADEGERAVERIEAAQRLLRETGQGSSLLELSVAMDLAESYREAGRLRDANASFEQAWERLAALGRDRTEKAGTLLNNWALVVRGLGQPLAAERLFRRAIEISTSGAENDSVSPMLLTNYARTLLDLGRLPEAKTFAERGYGQARRSGNEVAVTLALFLRQLLYVRLGDVTQATKVFAELEPRVKRHPAGHYQHAVLASQRGMLAAARGDTAGARAAFDQSIALGEEQDLPILLLRRSGFELASGRYEEARADAARTLALSKKSAEPATFSSRIGQAHLALARALHVQGKLGEARASAAAALENLTPSMGAAHPDTRSARAMAAETGGEAVAAIAR